MSLRLCCFLLFPACCLPHWNHDPRPGWPFILPSGYSLLSRLAMYTVSASLSLQCVVPFQLLTEQQRAGIKLSLLLFLYSIYNQTMPLPPASTKRKWSRQLSWVPLVRGGLLSWTHQGTQATDESKQPRCLLQQKKVEGLFDKYCSTY